MGTEGEQSRSGGYPERDGGEGEGLGLGYYLVYRLEGLCALTFGFGL